MGSTEYTSVYNSRGNAVKVIKGQTEYKKWGKGAKLTRKEAMLAMCYQCNGEKESAVDCGGVTCPLYTYSPYKGVF